MILTVAQAWWYWSAGLFLLAVASDLLDGSVARRNNQVTAAGGLIDHAADAVFVTVTITALALARDTLLLLPILIVLAFMQYVIDSRAHQGHRLIASRLGRYNGIGYFLLAGGFLLEQIFQPSQPWRIGLAAAYWLLVISTLLSMLDRALARRQS